MHHSLRIVASSFALGAVLILLMMPTAGFMSAGQLLDPLDGAYRTARAAAVRDTEYFDLPELSGVVQVLRDDRGVPHLFAESDKDAITALGFVVAQDRLFQIDYLCRVASGRLAEVLGPEAVAADRFLRDTGMAWGAKKNWQRIMRDGGVERDVIEWYANGVNAYLLTLEADDLPLEFRLLGYRPSSYDPSQVLLLMQFMAYDLTYRGVDRAYARIVSRYGLDVFGELYPDSSPMSVPIVPSNELAAEQVDIESDYLLGGLGTSENTRLTTVATGAATTRQAVVYEPLEARPQHDPFDYTPGKGSNNWVVDGSRSVSGFPLLAGDMHLSLTMPSIWYEAHLVTPEMNVYGVTIPGSPLPIEAFTDSLAWAFTNTGADQIDHYVLRTDPAARRYWFDDAWRQFEIKLDTIHVRGSFSIVDSIRFTVHGPATYEMNQWFASRWTAHDSSQTTKALWGMIHSNNKHSFEQSLRFWDTPMQNILYADANGSIGIRSTGHLPLRSKSTGRGLLDGSTSEELWSGRVPFDELPHANAPTAGFLTSTNQRPADASYPYYLGYDWQSVFRSIRIDGLLRARSRHGVEDFKRYQSDVVTPSKALFLSLVDSTQLTPPSRAVFRLLSDWDGTMNVGSAEPVALDAWLTQLESTVWDEDVFEGVSLPHRSTLWRMVGTSPSVNWFDIVRTEREEVAAEVVLSSFESAMEQLFDELGPDVNDWRWGDRHHLLLKHITRLKQFEPMWRGPVEFGGHAETLSPGRGREVTHSASWRVIVDLSTTPPSAYGIYPGGQSGNPFSKWYDNSIEDYLQFEYYSLLLPRTPEDLDREATSSTLQLRPR